MKLSLLLIPLLILTTSCGQKEENSLDMGVSEQKLMHTKNMPTSTNGLSEAKATLKTVHGNIVFKFYPQKAPQTVTRIIELIESGFYNGLEFHRVVPNFVVQTGDPTATGRGGSGQKLNAEFNDVQHIKGTVAMARGSDENSADSQFYIALTTLPNLDHQYTVFGQVVEGSDLLSKITMGDKILSLSFSELP